jgi:hypothetical protein
MTTRWPAVQRHRHSSRRASTSSTSIDDALERARERQKTMAAAAGSRAMQSTEGIEAAGGQPSVH